MRDPDELRAAGHAGLDEVDEARTRPGRDLQIGSRGEGVEIGLRLVRPLGGDDPDPAVARRPSRAPHGGTDDLDGGHGIPLPGVVENGGGGGVAGDHQHLDAMVDEAVEAFQGKAARLGDRPRTIGRAGGVAEIGDRLGRQLVEDGPGDGEPAIPGIEDPDRCVRHSVEA